MTSSDTKMSRDIAKRLNLKTEYVKSVITQKSDNDSISSMSKKTYARKRNISEEVEVKIKVIQKI